MKPYPNSPASGPAPPGGCTPQAGVTAARVIRMILPALVALIALLAWAPVPAQAERDPTRAPEVFAAAAPGGAAPSTGRTLHQLLVVDGRRYVVDGSRLRGVGDMLGAARIESIEDAAVVVRDAGGIRRLQLHAGVVIKRPAPQARPAVPNSR